MSGGAGAVAGADGVFLWIGSGRVALRCATHPDVDESCAIGEDGTVPATWVASVLAGHMSLHPPAEETVADDPVRAAATVSELDEFAREVAARCRWAITANGGDPANSWTDNYRIAVALVLGNHEYLQDMGPGPGYSPAEAAMVLVRGMTHRPADPGVWIDAIRAQIRQPGQPEQSELWTPATESRSGR